LPVPLGSRHLLEGICRIGESHDFLIGYGLYSYIKIDNLNRFEGETPMRVRDPKAAVARGGFTLMEMLVVVAIIVLLAGIGVPIFLNRLEESRKRTAWANAKTIAQQAEIFAMDNGAYPTSLNELMTPPNGHLPYVGADALIDPWKHEFHYQYPGQHPETQGKPEVWSDGPSPGNQAGIIGNWMPSP
jgi:general secretion pathway protein G